MSVEFMPFSRSLAHCEYRRHLPHLRQCGATYFVTFRLADSIPRNVMEQWDKELMLWAKANGVAGIPGSDEWIRTFEQLPEEDRRRHEKYCNRRYHLELDKCQGSCLLRDPGNCRIVADALFFWHEKRGMVGDFVVMPNHTHALLTPHDDTDLTKWMGSVKQFSSRKINCRMGCEKRTLWQEESFDHIVRHLKGLGKIRRYIRDNPKKAGLCRGYEYYQAAWMDEWCDKEYRTL